MNSGVYPFLSLCRHLLAKDVLDGLVCNNVGPTYPCGRDLSFLDAIVDCDAADPEKLGQFRDSDVFFLRHSYYLQ